MKKTIILILSFILAITSMNVAAADLKEDFANTKKEMHQAYVKAGDNYISILTKKYNNDELKFIIEKVKLFEQRFKGKKVSENMNGTLQVLKYIRLGLLIEVEKGVEKKFDVINTGKILRDENHVFKLKTYDFDDKNDSFIKKEISGAFLVGENLLVASKDSVTDESGKTYDYINVCQSSDFYSLLHCKFIGKVVHTSGDLALVKIMDKDVDNKAVKISPDYKKFTGKLSDADLALYSYTSKEYENLKRKELNAAKSGDNYKILSSVDKASSGGILFDENEGQVLGVLIDGQKVVNINEIEKFIKDNASKTKSNPNMLSKLIDCLKTEYDYIHGKKTDYNDKATRISNLFKILSEGQFDFQKGKYTDYIAYSSDKGFKSEINIQKILVKTTTDEQRKEVKEKIKKFNDALGSNDKILKSNCKTISSNQRECIIKLPSGDYRIVHYKAGESSVVMMITYAESRGLNAAKSFNKTILNNTSFAQDDFRDNEIKFGNLRFDAKFSSGKLYKVSDNLDEDDNQRISLHIADLKNTLKNYSYHYALDLMSDNIKNIAKNIDSESDKQEINKLISYHTVGLLKSVDGKIKVEKVKTNSGKNYTRIIIENYNLILSIFEDGNKVYSIMSTFDSEEKDYENKLQETLDFIKKIKL
ncbi:MAG: hypothetical protein N4A38_01045 [Candidatus Gracilibacteria bacterium]|nr:hypothetical protein [Candidatus Gracilibacteria bacterium]